MKLEKRDQLLAIYGQGKIRMIRSGCGSRGIGDGNFAYPFPGDLETGAGGGERFGRGSGRGGGAGIKGQTVRGEKATGGFGVFLKRIEAGVGVAECFLKDEGRDGRKLGIKEKKIGIGHGLAFPKGF